MKGFLLLMTVWYTNVLATRAYTCHCDCRPLARNLYQVQTHHLYYSPNGASGGGSLNNLNSFQSLIKSSDQHKHTEQQSVQSHSENYEVQEKEVELAPIMVAELTQDKTASTSETLISKSDNTVQEVSYAESEESNKDSQSKSLTNSLGKPSIIRKTKLEVKQPKFYVHLQQDHLHSEDDEKSKESHHSHEHEHHHHDENIKYKFEYNVHDEKTKDIKNHKEERNGDLITGQYSLLEDNGNVRTVKYTADWKNGFNAKIFNSKKAPFSPLY